jgi:hypothetical protein
VLRAFKEIWELQVRKVRREGMVFLVLKEDKVLLDHKVQLEM